MHPLGFEIIVQQHIEGLRREAAVRRLRSSGGKGRAGRRAPRMKLQRAPAH